MIRKQRAAGTIPSQVSARITIQVENSKTRILITGGFGAIGSNLIQALQAQGNVELQVVDNLSAGIANFSRDISFTHMDIGNAEKVKAFFSRYQPQVIFHLASHFANQNSVDHPISDAMTNVLGIINLLETQRKNPLLQKVVYASSSCVYGNNPTMAEDQPVLPYDTPYAINKYVGELYCKYYADIQKVPIVCARIFNSYGPGEMPGAYRNVIPNFIKKALNDEDIVITGTGEETRDFTYVSDTIDLLIKLANSAFRNAEVFNGGTGRKTPIKVLAESIVRIAESKSKIIFTEPRSWDHARDRCSDVSKSRQQLHYSPTVKLEDGLVETVKWVKSKLMEST